MQNMHFFIYIPLILAVFASAQDKLPDTETCGKLNTRYLYNQETTAELDEFPWMGILALQRTKFKTDMHNSPYSCVAVLISKRYMVTIADCISYNEPYAVVLGDWDTANKVNEFDCNDIGKCAPVPQKFSIEEIVFSPNYKPYSLEYNIALLRLNETVTFSDYIRPICLPGKEEAKQKFIAQHLELTGWHNHGFGPAEKITKNFVHIRNLKACRSIFNRSDTYNSEMNICAINPEIECKYERGSALMGVKLLDAVPAYYYLVGLYSRLMSDERSQDIFFRIDAHLDWIKNNIY